jgi:hypothetical protein
MCKAICPLFFEEGIKMKMAKIPKSCVYILNVSTITVQSLKKVGPKV